MPEIWKTSAISTGGSGDLRDIMPALVLSIKEHIGKDTGKQVLIKINEKDKRLDAIKGIEKKIDPKEKEKNAISRLLDFL